MTDDDRGEPRPDPPVNAADAHRQQLDCARRMRKARDRQEQAGKAATFLARLAQKEADKATLTERVKKGDNQRERDARIRQTKLDPDLSRRARKVGLRAQFDYQPEDIGDLEGLRRTGGWQLAADVDVVEEEGAGVGVRDTAREQAATTGGATVTEAKQASPRDADGRFFAVEGECPACGTRSLFLADGCYVTCSLWECPDPGMASDLLAGDDKAVAAVADRLPFMHRDGPCTVALGKIRRALDRHDEAREEPAVLAVSSGEETAEPFDRSVLP